MAPRLVNGKLVFGDSLHLPSQRAASLSAPASHNSSTSDDVLESTNQNGANAKQHKERRHGRSHCRHGPSQSWHASKDSTCTSGPSQSRHASKDSTCTSGPSQSRHASKDSTCTSLSGTTVTSLGLPSDASASVSSSRCSSSSRMSEPIANSMYGFELGDRVTTRGSPDAFGPWRDMGDGIVIGLSWRKGMLDVRFDPGRETFGIKAKHLTKVTEDRSSILLETQHHTLSIGDGVALAGKGRGILQDAGPFPGTATVVFDEIGTRVVSLNMLTKVMAKEEIRKRQDEDIIENSKKVFQVNDCVQAKCDPWCQLGVGIVCRIGDKDNTAWVQFDPEAGQFLLKCSDLEPSRVPIDILRSRRRRRNIDENAKQHNTASLPTRQI